MLILASTSDLLRVTTEVASAVDVHASWADMASSVVTPGRTNTAISTATTTTVVASPAASTYRTVKQLVIRNSHAAPTLRNRVTVLHSDGTTIPELISAGLQPGESLIYEEHRGFFVVTAAGQTIDVTDTVYGTPAIGEIRTVTLQADVAGAVNADDAMFDVPGLTWPGLLGQTYKVRYIVPYTVPAASTGARWWLDGPGRNSLSAPVRICMQWPSSTTAQTHSNGQFTWRLHTVTTTSAATAGSNLLIVEGVIAALIDTGPITFLAASETNGQTLTVKAGATAHWQRVL